MKIINVNGKDYALKLTIGSIKNLEKRLGKNPLNYFIFDVENYPEITPFAIMFHACLVNMNHGITEDESDAILSDWVAEYAKAHEDAPDNAPDKDYLVGLINLITEVFQDAGFLPKNKEEKKTAEKGAKNSKNK